MLTHTKTCFPHLKTHMDSANWLITNCTHGNVLLSATCGTCSIEWKNSDSDHSQALLLMEAAPCRIRCTSADWPFLLRDIARSVGTKATLFCVCVCVFTLFSHFDINTLHSVFWPAEPLPFFPPQLLLHIIWIKVQGTRRADALTICSPAIDLLHCAGGRWWAPGWCRSCASLPDKTGLAAWCICYNVCSLLPFPCEETSEIRE